MNNHELLEKQLASWKPRQPSLKVKKRLFGSSGETTISALYMRQWLAVAAICMVTAIGALSNLPVSAAATNAPHALAALHAVSNSENAAFIPPMNLQHNQFAQRDKTTLEWTKPLQFPSTNGFILQSVTNTGNFLNGVLNHSLGRG